MKNLLTDIIAQLVEEKSTKEEYGVSIINLPDFDYARFIKNLNFRRKVELYFLGFNQVKVDELRAVAEGYGNLSVYFDVEKAEESRNSGDEETFRILVIKRQETEKLSSLRWFPEITLEDVYKRSCKVVREELKESGSNKVICDLIGAINRKVVRDILGFEMVLDYLECLKTAVPENLPSVMKSQFYKLGLCADSSLDQGSPSVENFVKIIKHNHDIVQRISNLEQSERKCLMAYSARPDADRTIPQTILKYYRTKSIDLLAQLDITDVENSLKAAKTTSGNAPSGNRQNKRKTVNPTTAASQFIFDDSTDLINDVLESAKDKIDDRQKANKRDKIEVEAGDVKIQVTVDPTTEKIADDVLSAETSYGEIIYADVQSPSEAIDNINKFKTEAIDAMYINEIIDRLDSANEFILGGGCGDPTDGLSITKHLREFITLRNKIFPFKKRLQDIPMFVILSHRQLFSNYLNAYKKLLDSINEDFRKIWDLAPSDAKTIVSRIMSMDYVFVLGKDACHAMPTSLNPLYLWKYIKLAEEILDGKNVDSNEEGSLSESDKDFIIRKSESIPDPLSVTVIPATIRREGSLYLPLSGRIGTIPVYSTRRQIDQDEAGIDTIQQSIIRYLCLYPHAGMMLKITVIDPPTVESIISMLKGLSSAREFNIKGLEVSIYKTKESAADWLSIDDKSFNEGILGRVKSKNDLKFGLNIHPETTSYQDILNSIDQQQHMMVIFDPNEVRIDTASNNKTIHIHPLCVPKIYTYNPVSDKVEIRPSNEGDIFSTYSSIVEKLNEHPSSFNHTSTFFQTPLERSTYDDMLKKADWLVILDQSLKNWDISLKSASEKLFYKEDSYRSVGIYSNNCRKFIRGCNDLFFRLGNYIPKEMGVKDIIESIRDLNNDGLLSIISHNSNRIFEEKHGKGSLGLAIAAIQYKSVHPDSLLVGLDTQMAKEWLSEREDGILPDLIGIRFSKDENMKAEIDVIEVKTYGNSPNSFQTDGNTITGHAVDQAFVLEDLMNEMFGKTEKITTVSRREILREQVFESLFQNGQERKQKQMLSRQLNDLFAGEYRILVNKQISFVDFEHEESGDEFFKADQSHNEGKIKLTTIGQLIIRSIITKQMIGVNPVSTGAMTTEELISSIQTSQIGSEQVNTEEATSTDTTPNEDIQVVGTSSTVQASPTSIEEASHSGQPVPDSIVISKSSSVPEVKIPSPEVSEEVIEKCKCLDKVFSSFNIQAKRIDPKLVLETARFTRYKIGLQPGETLKQIQSRADDIAIQMAANGKIRIEHIKGTNLIAVDIPHAKAAKPINLLDYLEKLQGVKGNLNILAGQNAENEVEVLDIADMPHLLVAGTTGSGKTVFLHSIIVSLLSQFKPDEIDFLIIDPKQTDFTFFEDLPNLYGGEVITDCDTALAMINKINDEDKVERTSRLKQAKCKDILSYNAKNPSNRMKRLVVIIDEYADLIATADQNGNRKEFEAVLNMLAQRVRNLGINLIVATQRPSAKIVTGNIKANIPSRVSFRLASHTDSQTILDEPGAEDLLGKGDMIIKTETNQTRLQGFYISEDDLQSFITNYLNDNHVGH